MAEEFDAWTGEWHKAADGNANGNNPYSGSQNNGTAQVSDKGNTADTNKSIAESTNNKTIQKKYAEEANFTCTGSVYIRRNGILNVTDGVAERWKGAWEIREATHTIDAGGYVVEGKLARKPYLEESEDKSKSANNPVGNDGSPTPSTQNAKTDTPNNNSASASGSSGGSSSSDGQTFNPWSGEWE